MWLISFCDTTVAPITVEKIIVTGGGVLEILDPKTHGVLRYLSPNTWADVIWEPKQP